MADKNDVIAGRYRLTDQIGSKDGVRTYKALDNEGEVAAIELLPAQTGKDVARLDQWARKMSDFDHPDLPRVFDYGAQGQSFYVAREYVVGTNLKTMIAGGPLEISEAIKYAMQVCSALSVAHGLGIVHGDLRPHNLVVTRDDAVKVTEFQMPPTRTRQGGRTATAPESWHYVSPEEAIGWPVTSASDIYSLGVVLYELVTGTVPFDAATADAVREMQEHAAPRPPRELNSHVTPELQALIARAMAKDPAERYASVDAMREDLSKVLASVQTEEVARKAAVAVAPAAVAVPAAAKAAPQRSSWPWIALAVLLALATVVAIAYAAVTATQVAVPKLAGQTQTQAETNLTSLGLKVGTVTRLPVAQGPVGVVVAQKPISGAPVFRGSPVKLTVTVQKMVPVPDLRGQTEAQAIAALTQAGLKIGKPAPVFNSVVPAGQVLTQSPGPGKNIAAGSVVDLNFSQGPRVSAVPNVVGLLEAGAVEQLEVDGFRIITNRVYDNTVPFGAVVSQSPTAGSDLAARSQVTILVSLGPRYVVMPSVLGLPRADALDSLHRAGLNVNVSFATSSTAVNDVLSQEPAPGTAIAPDTWVGIKVGN